MPKEEAIEKLKRTIELRKNKCGKITHDTCIVSTAQLETLIEALEKKNKIIDLMAEEIDDCGECPHEIYEEDFDCEHCENYSSINCWRQYFEKKVEEE